MKIKIEDLAGEQREIAEAIGLEAYLKLVKVYGGTTVYIARLNYLEMIERDKKIISEHTGYNGKYICNKYKISDRTLRYIIERNQGELPGQLSFFDKIE